MNLGRVGIQKEKSSLESSSARLGSKTGVTALRVMLYILIALIAAIISIAVGSYRGIIDDTPNITDENIMPLGYASFIYDAEGNQIQKLSSVNGNRVSVSISDIPIDMQHAIVAIEDSRFYTHNGVDPHGIVRAVIVALQSGFTRSEGASTITQQLLKNNVFTDWMNESRLDTIKRKIQEQYLAVQLEASLNASGQNAKEVILENYLNTVNFGAGAYGIQTASQTYFGKDCKDLTLSECAVLAAIPQNPSRYNPITNPENNAERRTTVLDYMLEQGYISQEEHDEALADNVYDRIEEQHTSSSSSTEEVYSYFVDALIDQVKEDLMKEKGYTEVQATNAIYSGGLKIYSTEDPTVQSIMEEEFQDEDNYPDGTQYSLDWALTVDKADGTRVNYSKEMLQNYFVDQGEEDFDLMFSSEEEAQSYVDKYKAAVVGDGDTVFAERITFTPEPQACMTVIDQKTGYIKGIVGGRGVKEGSLTLNRATDSSRQPGSTFKILSTYGPALNEDKITLATTETDEKYYYEDGTEVKNSNNKHSGEMTIRKAITKSNNVIAVKVLTEITPEVGYNYLKRLGFTTLTDEDAGQPLALGGITNGVKNVELTAAFATIANGGEYNEPVFYTKVTDQQGNTILENESNPTRVFKESTAYLLTSAMEDVVTKGTGTSYQLDCGMPVAGKTGTTDDYRDHMFVGFTPYYTAAIWSGYDDNSVLDDNERTYDSTLWTAVMDRINETKADADFEMPSSVEKLTVCSTTGLLARSTCPSITEYFASATAPTEYCTKHRYSFWSYYSSGSSSSGTSSSNTSGSTDTTSGTGTSGSTGTTGGTGTSGSTGTTSGTGTSGSTGTTNGTGGTTSSTGTNGSTGQ